MIKYKIFFDFDGPINNVAKRYFIIHKILLKKLNIRHNNNFEKYWKIKRSKKDLIFFKKKILYKKKYLKFWMKFIEKKKFLHLDKLHFYSIKTLKILRNKKYELYLITLRNNKKNLINQITKYKIKYLFKKIICPKKNKKIGFSKYYGIKNSKVPLSNSIIIGDTEEDIIAGKLLNIPSVAVLNGIRNKKLIVLFKHTYIINNINKL